jgi:hypothetical protein
MPTWLASFRIPFPSRDLARAAGALALALAFHGPAAAQFGTALSNPPPLVGSVAEPDLGSSISVGAVTITPAEVRRELVYSKGMTMLESMKIDIFIDEEIRQRVAMGEPASAFELPAELVEAETTKALAGIKQNYPDLDEVAVLRMNGMTPENFRNQVLQTQRFDRVFLPEKSKDWPQRTRDALMKNFGESGGQDFLDKLAQSEAQQDAAGAAPADGGAPAATPAQQEAGKSMMKMILRKVVIQSLGETADVLMASDGLAEDLVMKVNGVPIRTDEVWARIKGLVTPDDVERARTWLLKTRLMRADLEARGFWMSDEEFAAAYAKHQEPYANSPLKLDVVVLGFKRFPSMETYKTYYRLQESFERSIAGELVEGKLAEHAARANDLMGLARVNVELILCSAYDFQSGTWKPDGWVAAEREANQVVDELAAGGGANWNELLERHSDFWDPPAPATPQPTPTAPPQSKNKGRFGLLNRNELVQRLGESDYTMFLTGESLADALFFDQEPGTFGGPWKGPYGYYISRVTQRTPPTKSLSLSIPEQRDLIAQDRLTVLFNAYGREILARN